MSILTRLTLLLLLLQGMHDAPPSYISHCRVSYKFLHSSFVARRPFVSFYMHKYLHCVSKKLPPLNFLYLCQILTDFQFLCTAVKRKKFATKPIRHYRSHLRQVDTLPWDIIIQIFCIYGRKRKQIGFCNRF